MVFLAWLLVTESHAQRQQSDFQNGSIREEDIPADPQPFRPPSQPDQTPQRATRPSRQWFPFFSRRDEGPPPTVLEPPTLPFQTQADEEVDGAEPAEPEAELVSKKNKKKEELTKKEDSLALPPHELVALRFVEEGEEILESGDVERARILFEQAVELAPFQPYSYYFLGRISFAQGKLKQALAFLYKAEIFLAKGNKEWLGETTCLRGLVAEDLGDLEQARSAYERCSYHTPRNLRAVTALTRLTEDFPEPEPAYPPIFPKPLPQTNVFPRQPDYTGNRDVVR